MLTAAAATTEIGRALTAFSTEPVEPAAEGDLVRAERAAIIAVPARGDNNKSRAVRILGVSRTTLYTKIVAHRIEAGCKKG